MESIFKYMKDITELLKEFNTMKGHIATAEKCIKSGEFYTPEGMLYCIQNQIPVMVRLVKSNQDGSI